MAALDPEDFSDVFGGPPRTVLLRKFSRGLLPRPPSEVFYDDASPGERMSRDRSNGFSMSKSKSKSNSSSVLSSEELSPLRPRTWDDAGLSSFCPKLRPINVPCRWNSTADFPNDHQEDQVTPVVPFGRPFPAEDRFMEDLYKLSNFEPTQRSRSPETFAAEPSVKMPAEEEVKAASPSSVISGDWDQVLQERDDVLALSDEEDEISSSYVIEITPGISIRDGDGKTSGIDQAVAWDKERLLHDNVWTEGKESWGRARSWKELIVPEKEEQRKPSDQAGILCANSKSSQMIEFEALDRNMKKWTSGTEKDIRQLLSTLHQIMWPNSGWDAVLLTSLRESSQVKKAYQKARLCLQPDRLQQIGATFLQKYIAHKALTIIQDSWTKYISEGNSTSSDHNS